MKNVGKAEICKILDNNMDFVLEFDTVCETSKKPVYTFIDAFTGNAEIPEFCLVYAEIDDTCDLNEIYVSVNSSCSEFDIECCEKIYGLLITYKSLNLIAHRTHHMRGGENIKNLMLKNYKNIKTSESDFCESFYFDASNESNFLYPVPDINVNIRPLTAGDRNLCGCFFDEKDDYLPEMFDYMLRDPVYDDCGIIGRFDGDSRFTGYIAYYGIGGKIRDVSYIYVGEKYRGKNYSGDLLEFFVHKNVKENKISYYSYADGEISKRIVTSHKYKSFRFESCAERYETIINAEL